LTLAYDGTNYRGWQIQPQSVTVQGTLETALAKITGERIRVAGSGRTDAGVHALGQTASFTTASELPPERLLRALNAQLPEDIAVLAVREVPEGFHARRDARSKHYRYIIHDGPVRDVFARRYTWQVRSRLDEKAMDRAASALVGEHDFASFQTTGSPRHSTVRTITELSVRRGQPPDVDRVIVDIQADGFLYNMARAIVGTLFEVGRAGEGEAFAAQVLEARDRRAGAQTAPPQGLFLVSVAYDL
jgi:tRNA pseudouridine38-40 synthase